MKLEKVKSVLSNILESKEKTIADPVEPIETGVDVIDAETAEEDTEKINKEVNKRIKDSEKNALAVKGEDHAEEPKLVKESKEFKKEERKELGAFIHELKEKKIKHRVSRSVNEGYRYLVEYLTEGKLNEVDLNGETTDTVEVSQSKIKPEVKGKEDDEEEVIIVNKEKEDEEQVEEAKEKTVTELCPFCEEEVELKAIKYIPQKCPNCGKLIKACSLCDLDKENCTACEKKYPTEGLKEGAEGKKVPGMEYVIYDASEDGKAPIVAIRSTYTEAQWFCNRKGNFGKELGIGEAPKGRFHKGDDFWGPFDANWEKMESCNEAKEEHIEVYCYSSKPEIYTDRKKAIADFKDAQRNSEGSEQERYTNVLFDLEDGFNICWDQVTNLPAGVEEKYNAQFEKDESLKSKRVKPVIEAIDTSKEVWEGWTVQDFIDELEPSFEMIMRGEAWIKPFANKEELKKWCMSEQPYYKKYIPEVVSYFDGRVKEMGGYGKKGNSGLFGEGVISGAPKLSYDELAELEKSLWDKLNAQGIYPEDGTFSNSSNSLADLDLEMLIDGDWKHDHLLAETIVEEWCEENGYVISRHTDEVTNDTGRDDYEALHKWILIKDTDGKMKDTVAGFKKMFKSAEPEEDDEPEFVGEPVDVKIINKEEESLKEEVSDKESRPLYRVVLVQWLDAYNSDTDYLEDFATKEEAVKYIEENKESILEGEKEFLEDRTALDLDVEEWDEMDDISVVYSTELWSREPQKEFLDISMGDMPLSHIDLGNAGGALASGAMALLADDEGEKETLELEPRLEVEYWYDEEARDQGLGDIYFGDIEDEEAGIELVRKMIDRDGFASAELLLDGECIYGYDGESEWGPRAKKSESLKEAKEEKEEPKEDAPEESEEGSEDEIEIKAVTDVNSEEVTTTVGEIKDIALEATKAAMAEEESAEKILPEEEVKEITDEVVNDQLGLEDEDDVSWLTSNDMSALSGEPSEEEPSEESEEEISDLEDEDDVSWLK